MRRSSRSSGPRRSSARHRDVWFAKDKTPYKNHQGAFVRVGESTGWYVEVSPRGIRTGAGFYEASGPLAAFRGAVAHDTFWPELEKILRSLEKQGFEIGGDRLKTTPRGYDADHPRIELLRHKSLTLGHQLGFEPVIHTPELLDLVRDDWRALRPLVEWVSPRRLSRRPGRGAQRAQGRGAARPSCDLGLPEGSHRRDPAVVVR